MTDIKAYQDTQDNGANDSDLMQHIALVKRVALHLKARLPSFMELDELIQVGMIGLIEADKTFDASKGVDFVVFAKNRIRGAILDQVRKLSHLPRSAIVNIRAHNEASSILSSQLGRPPTHTELAEFMGKELDEFHKERTHSNRFQTMSLDDESMDTGEIPATNTKGPEAFIADSEIITSLKESIETLPERDQMVISLYYVEELNLKEIGAILEVSESRVSQILSSCVKKLRTKMSNIGG